MSGIKIEDWEKEKTEEILLKEAEKFSEEVGKEKTLPEEEMVKIGDRGYLLWPFRVALSGKKASAGPFEIADILGKEKTLKRIKEALSKVSI